MDRVFLDANVLFSAACRPQGPLWRLWTLNEVQLVTSLQAAEEARRNLETPEQLEQLETLLEEVEVVMAPSRPLGLPVNLPEEDRTIFLAAVAAKATHFLTGDFRHFSAHYGKEILGVLILPPAEYFRLKGI